MLVSLVQTAQYIRIYCIHGTNAGTATRARQDVVLSIAFEEHWTFPACRQGVWSKGAWSKGRGPLQLKTMELQLDSRPLNTTRLQPLVSE